MCIDFSAICTWGQDLQPNSEYLYSKSWHCWQCQQHPSLKPSGTCKKETANTEYFKASTYKVISIDRYNFLQSNRMWANLLYVFYIPNSSNRLNQLSSDFRDDIPWCANGIWLKKLHIHTAVHFYLYTRDIYQQPFVVQYVCIYNHKMNFWDMGIYSGSVW